MHGTTNIKFFQTSESTHPATQYNIPEYFKIQQSRCQNFISCNINKNGDNSWHQNNAGFLWAYRDQSSFEHSAHQHSHFISLTKSKRTIKWRKVSRSKRKVSKMPTFAWTSFDFQIFSRIPASNFSDRSFSALQKVNTFLPQHSGIWKSNLKALNIWNVLWFLWWFNSFAKKKAW